MSRLREALERIEKRAAAASAGHHPALRVDQPAAGPAPPSNLFAARPAPAAAAASPQSTAVTHITEPGSIKSPAPRHVPMPSPVPIPNLASAAPAAPPAYAQASFADVANSAIPARADTPRIDPPDRADQDHAADRAVHAKHEQRSPHLPPIHWQPAPPPSHPARHEEYSKPAKSEWTAKDTSTDTSSGTATAPSARAVPAPLEERPAPADEPSSSEPSSSEPSSSEPSSAEPSSSEPSSSEPSSSEPSSAETSSAEPSSTETCSAEPPSAKLSSAKPPSAKLSSAKLSTAKLSTAKLSTAKLSTAEPSTAEPPSAELSSAEPSSAEPTSAERSAAEQPAAHVLSAADLIIPAAPPEASAPSEVSIHPPSPIAAPHIPASRFAAAAGPAPSVMKPFQQTCRKILAALPGEGTPALLFAAVDAPYNSASTMANLAVAMTDQIDAPVLAIDASRDAALTKQLRVKSTNALMRILRGTTSWEDCIVQTSLPGLCLLPSKPGPDRVAPFAFQRLLTELKSQFGLLLIDVGTFDETTALGLAGLCTGTYLTVRQGHTTKDRARAAHRQLKSSGGNLAGCVLISPTA